MIDFQLIHNKKEISFRLDGWRTYLTIEYGNYKISEQVYLVWKIKYTSHIFNIPLRYIFEQHKGNYKEHFQLVLTKFREDLIQWNELKLQEDWMKKYWNEFGELIY